MDHGIDTRLGAGADALVNTLKRASSHEEAPLTDARTVSDEEVRAAQASLNDHPSIRPEALKKGMKAMIGGVPHKVTAVRPNGKITLTSAHGKKVVLILNQDGKYEIRGNK